MSRSRLGAISTALRLGTGLALVALDSEGGRRDWHCGELIARSAGLSGAFAARGVRRGDVVMTLLGNRIEWVLSLLACWRMGAVALPCSTMLRRKPPTVPASLRHPGKIVLEDLVSDLLKLVQRADLLLPALVRSQDQSFVITLNGKTRVIQLPPFGPSVFPEPQVLLFSNSLHFRAHRVAPIRVLLGDQTLPPSGECRLDTVPVCHLRDVI